MDSKTVNLNFLTLGRCINEPIAKKVECSFKETELHCLASHWLMRVWSCVVCCESSLSSSESIRESTLVSVMSPVTSFC